MTTIVIGFQQGYEQIGILYSSSEAPGEPQINCRTTVTLTPISFFYFPTPVFFFFTENYLKQLFRLGDSLVVMSGKL